MKRVHWHVQAERELEAAGDWYEERAGLAERLGNEGADAVRRLRSAPKACAPLPEVEDARVRRPRVHGFPYHVVFVDRPRSVFVVALVHTSRKPGYWRDRLPPA